MVESFLPFGRERFEDTDTHQFKYKVFFIFPV